MKPTPDQFPGRFKLRRYATRGFTFANAGDLERLEAAITEALDGALWIWAPDSPVCTVEVGSTPRLVVEFCGRLSVPPSRRS